MEENSVKRWRLASRRGTLRLRSGDRRACDCSTSCSCGAREDGGGHGGRAADEPLGSRRSSPRALNGQPVRRDRSRFKPRWTFVFDQTGRSHCSRLGVHFHPDSAESPSRGSHAPWSGAEGAPGPTRTAAGSAREPAPVIGTGWSGPAPSRNAPRTGCPPAGSAPPSPRPAAAHPPPSALARGVEILRLRPRWQALRSGSENLCESVRHRPRLGRSGPQSPLMYSCRLRILQPFQSKDIVARSKHSVLGVFGA